MLRPVSAKHMALMAGVASSMKKPGGLVPRPKKRTTSQIAPRTTSKRVEALRTGSERMRSLNPVGGLGGLGDFGGLGGIGGSGGDSSAHTVESTSPAQPRVILRILLTEGSSSAGRLGRREKRESAGGDTDCAPTGPLSRFGSHHLPLL